MGHDDDEDGARRRPMCGRGCIGDYMVVFVHVCDVLDLGVYVPRGDCTFICGSCENVLDVGVVASRTKSTNHSPQAAHGSQQSVLSVKGRVAKSEYIPFISPSSPASEHSLWIPLRT